MQDTWWLWLFLVGIGIILGIFVEWVFFISIPISIFAFVYFGIMRYDEDGNQVGDRFN